LPVHIAGQSVDMPAIARIAERQGLTVIEDACHALGTVCSGGDMVGSCRYSKMAVFSFHPVKTIAMGEGGAVTTNDRSVYDRLLSLRSHGMTRDPLKFRNVELAFGSGGKPNPWYYEMQELGFNYRASDIHCALGLSQLKKLDEFIAKRRSLARAYDRLLVPLSPAVLAPQRVAGCDPAWHLYAVRIDFGGVGIPREVVVERLRDAGIGTQVHYIPVHMQPYYADRVGSQQLPGAMEYFRATLSVPLFPSMGEEDVERVVDALSRSLK
jgi:dTDP-4-amino-4,6-dideoxygalactose transaminase